LAAEFGVLGAVEAQIDGRPVDLGHARQRAVLGVLLAEAGRPVPVDQLVDRVWGEDVPQRVAGALYSYLSRLRRAVGDAAGVAIKRQPGGYLLTVDPQVVDLHQFRRLVMLARSSDSDQGAAESFAAALGLWRGEPFAGLDTPWLTSMRQVLFSERFAAELDRNDVLLRLGRHAELLPALSAAVAEHPLDERLAEQSMLALYRCGRQGDADEPPDPQLPGRRAGQRSRRRPAQTPRADPGRRSHPGPAGAGARDSGSRPGRSRPAAGRSGTGAVASAR
jgi:DNA-binding SARP family transcriptional activator